MNIKKKIKDILEDGVSVETMMFTFLIGVVFMILAVIIA